MQRKIKKSWSQNSEIRTVEIVFTTPVCLYENRYLLGLPFLVHMHRIEEILQTLSRRHFSTSVTCQGANYYKTDWLNPSSQPSYHLIRFICAYLSLSLTTVLNFGGFILTKINVFGLEESWSWSADCWRIRILNSWIEILSHKLKLNVFSM